MDPLSLVCPGTPAHYYYTRPLSIFWGALPAEAVPQVREHCGQSKHWIGKNGDFICPLASIYQCPECDEVIFPWKQRCCGCTPKQLCTGWAGGKYSNLVQHMFNKLDGLHQKIKIPDLNP
jgi:hypothetical protein